MYEIKLTKKTSEPWGLLKQGDFNRHSKNEKGSSQQIVIGWSCSGGVICILFIMPLSEFLRMSRRKHESDQQISTTHLTDLSSIPENDFVELVWDNGQPAMHGQSSRVKKSHNLNNIPPHHKSRGKFLENANSSRKVKIGSVESFLDDGLPGVPSIDTDLNQHGDLVPWLNYPVDEFLPDVSGVTVNEQANQNSLSSMNKSRCIQTFGHLQNLFEPNTQKLEQSISMNGSSRTGLMPLRSSRQEQTSIPSFTSGVSDVASCSASTSKDAVMRESVQDQPSSNGYLDMRMQKPDLALPGPVSRSSLPNFPFLSRYTSLNKANLHHTADPTASCSLLEAMANKEKNQANGTTPVESSEVLANNLQKENDFHNQSSNSSKVDQRPSGSQLYEQSGLVKKSFKDQRPSGSLPREQSCSIKKSYELCQEDQEKNNNSLNQVIGPDSNKRDSDDVKAAEPVVAASSVCSGSSGDRASNDQPRLKRKCHDIEESEYRSEDVEEESVGVRKTTPTRGAGSKRGRAAEVHNLSERRRRDRINEKMRALQELIPNCNKTDKASMLDEAIEYLKTLQLQVQVMSMGTGLWMPPMMFPSGMRHMHATHMPNLSPLGIGVGFGMNMLDMNGGFPMFPVPPMQHPPLPSQSLSRPGKFSGLVSPNIPVPGHPGQGHPMSVPRAPTVPFSSHTSTSSSTGMGVTTVGFQMEAPSASPTPNITNHAEDKNAQLMHDADVSRLISLTSNQLLQTNESTGQLNQSLRQKSNQATNVHGDVDVNSANGDIVPEGKAGSN
ncbi:hypothetical protein Leryth_004282 [Lithospermum erythrorhizon]|nr:hypothetical protein Leryth_004282 [Lithospermum erythrorhizon]